jgi:anaerobic C4-dicarboxylate transporter
MGYSVSNRPPTKVIIASCIQWVFVCALVALLVLFTIQFPLAMLLVLSAIVLAAVLAWAVNTTNNHREQKEKEEFQRKMKESNLRDW